MATPSPSSTTMSSSSSSSLIPLNRRDTLQLIDNLLLSYSKEPAITSSNTLPRSESLPSSSSLLNEQGPSPTPNDEDTVSAFITHGTEYLSLETIRTILSEKLTLIKQDLVQVINKDYTAFVALSSSLEKSDRTILNLREPLAVLSAQLTDIFHHIRTYDNSLHQQSNIALIYTCITECTELIMFIQEKLTLAEQYFGDALRIPGGDIRNSTSSTSTSFSSSSSAPIPSLPSNEENKNNPTTAESRLMKDIQSVFRGFTQNNGSNYSHTSSFISSTIPSLSSSTSSSSSSTAFLVQRAQLLYRGTLLFITSEQYLVQIIDIIQLLCRKFETVPSSGSPFTTSIPSPSPSVLFRASLPYDTLKTLQSSLQRIMNSSLLPLIETTTEQSLTFYLSNRKSSSGTSDSSESDSLASLLTAHPSLLAFYYCSLSVSLLSTSSVSCFLQYYYKAILTAYTLPYYDQTILLPSSIEDNARGSFRGLGKSLTVLINDITQSRGMFNTFLFITKDLSFIDILTNCCWVPLVAKLTSTPILWTTMTSSSNGKDTNKDSSNVLSLPSPTITLSTWSLASSFFSTIPHIFHNNYTQLSNFFLQLLNYVKNICVYSPSNGPLPLSNDIGNLYKSLQRLQTLNTFDTATDTLSNNTSFPLVIAPSESVPSSPVTVATILVSHPSTLTLTNIWKSKLPIYSQLRTVEISQRIEQSLAQAKWSIVSATPSGPTKSSSSSSSSTTIACITVPLDDILPSFDTAKRSVFSSVFSPSSNVVSKLVSSSPSSSSPSTLIANISSSLTTSPSPTFRLTLPPTIRIWSTLRSLWSPATFLPPLLSSTIVHGLEILNRYIVWISKGLVLYNLKLNLYELNKFLSNQQHVTNNIPNDASVDTLGTTAPLPYSIEEYPFCSLPDNLSRSILTAEAQAVLDTLSKNIPNPGTPQTPASTPNVVPSPSVNTSSLSLPNLPTPSSLIMVTPVSHPDYFVWLDILQGSTTTATAHGTINNAMIPLASTTISSSAKSILLPYSAIESLFFTLSDLLSLSTMSGLLLTSYSMNYSGLLVKEEVEDSRMVQEKQSTIVSSILPSVHNLSLLVPSITYLVRYSLRQYNASVCAAIRAIPATFRMSNTNTANRTLPRTASVYVSSALRPLKTVLSTIRTYYSLPGTVDSVPATALSTSSATPDFFHHCSILVLQITMDLFTDIHRTLAQVFDNITTMEASLQWLKSSSVSSSSSLSNAGTGSTGSINVASITDTDKIGLQLYYDMIAIGNELVLVNNNDSNDVDSYLRSVYGVTWDTSNTNHLVSTVPAGNDATAVSSGSAFVASSSASFVASSSASAWNNYRQEITKIFNQQIYPLVQNYRTIATAIHSSTGGK